MKENYSLCALAELLYGMGDLERANHYIKISMEDANYYTTRLRSSQTSRMLPLIDRAYQQEKEIQQQRQRMFVTGICYPFWFPSIDSTLCAMANEKIVLCP